MPIKRMKITAFLWCVAVGLFAMPASASKVAAPPKVSRCFHPFSAYVSHQWTSEMRTEGHTMSRDGIIRYRPLDNHVYQMPFTVQVREVDGETNWRVVPDDENDTGPMGPNPDCAYRHWQD